MIAMKREVAAQGFARPTVAGFPWSEGHVRKLTTGHCTGKTTPSGGFVCGQR